MKLLFYPRKTYLFFVLFVTFSTLFGQNLIVNPSFNPFVDVDVNFVDDSWGLTGVPHGAGIAGGRLDPTSQSFQPSVIGPNNVIYQDISGLNPGATYDVSVWAKIQSGFTGPEDLYYDIYDISSSTIVASGTGDITAAITWQNFTFTFSATDTDLRIRLGVTNVASHPVIHFDDISVIEQVPPPPPPIPAGTMLLNGSFEPPFTGGVADKWSLVGATNPAVTSSGLYTDGTTSQQIGEGTVTSNFIYQLVTGLTVGQQYTVTFDARLTAGAFASFGVEVGIYSPVSGTMIYDNEFLYSALNTWERNSFTFVATETTAQLRFAGGLGITALLDRAYMLENDFPVITGVNIAGTAEAGYQLSASVVGYSDADGDLEDAPNHEYQWYRADNSTKLNIAAISGATGSTYKLTTSDVNKYIFVEISPAAQTGSTPGLPVISANPSGPIANNSAPYIHNVVVAGNLKEGQVVTLTFDITDAEDFIGYDVYTYRSPTRSGLNKTFLQAASGNLGAVTGSGVINYTLSYAEVNNYIIYEMTPTASAGITPGEKVTYVTASTVSAYEYGKPSLALPGPDDVNIPTQPIFNWNANDNAVITFEKENKYQLQLSTDLLFINVIYNKEIADASPPATASEAFTHTMTGITLRTGQSYYWRVRAKDDTKVPVRFSPWSTVQKFTTTEVSKPSLAYPIDNASVYTVLPRFYWYVDGYKPNVTYTLDIYTGTGKTGSHELNVPGISDLYYVLQAGEELDPGTYYWYITATQVGNTLESNEGVFTIEASSAGVAAVPTLSYPLDDCTVYTLTPSLYWYTITATTGLTYQVQVATDAAFSNIEFTTSGSENLYATVDHALLPNTKYYWRVQSFNGPTASGFSAYETFVTYTPAESGTVVTPIASWPVGGVEVYYSTVSLHWYLGSYSSGLTYEVDVATDDAFRYIVKSYTGITGLYKEVAGLSQDVTYFWRVRSTNGSAYSTYSATESFVIVNSAGGLVTPTLLSPVGGTFVSSKTPQLTWFYIGNMLGVSFEIKYGLYPDLITPIATETSDVFAMTVSTELNPGSTYYWAVRSTDGSNYSAWTSPGEFVILPSATSPVTPNPGSPVAGVTVNNLQPALSWFTPGSSDGLIYDLQLSQDPQFSGSATIEYKDLHTTSKVINELKSGSVYNWRVRARLLDGSYSSYSNYSTFVTPGLTAADDEVVVANEFLVAQNYPNPFNPSTSIIYSIPENGYVSIRIFNMLGQEVKTLISDEMNAGNYNVRWNGEDNAGSKVSSGTYIYRVEAGQHRITRKMLLLK